MIPVFSGAAVEAAVSPERAVEAVREAFVAYARGEWTMPPKVYVPGVPGRRLPRDARARRRATRCSSGSRRSRATRRSGLPTVMGLVLLSDASNGAPVAVLDAGAVTALRTGAAAVLAAETLGRRRRADRRRDRRRRQRPGGGADVRRARPPRRDLRRRRASGPRPRPPSSGASVAPSLEAALAADLVVTVTPGHEVVLPEGTLQPGPAREPDGRRRPRQGRDRRRAS